MTVFGVKMGKQIKAKLIVRRLLAKLEGRKGFDQWWHDIESDIKTEILSELNTVIDRALSDAQQCDTGIEDNETDHYCKPDSIPTQMLRDLVNRVDSAD